MPERDRFQPVIIAPTFDNARTLPAVLCGIDKCHLPVIVIDDGCTDDTAEILLSWRDASPQHFVKIHAVNLGKAAALRAGFEYANGMGFTHAVTIDTDGQLAPAQIPDLLRIAQKSPGSMVIGSRDASVPGYPGISRLGRWASNVLVQWQSGAHVSDSQCGFRVYPLRRVLALGCRAARYGFETEILTRAAWAGMGVEQISVDCAYEVPGGRVSHFRPWRDSLSAAGMHVRLLLRSLAPWPVKRVDDAATGTLGRRFAQWINPARAWRSVQDSPEERSRFAAGLAAGVFIANLPLYGLQTLLSLYVARRFRLHPLPVVIGSHLSTPPIGPLLIATAIAIGHLVIHGSVPSMSSIDRLAGGYMALIRSVLLEWVIGSLACGFVLAGLTFLITQSLLRRLPLRRREVKGVPSDTHPGTSLDCRVPKRVA